MRGRVGTDTDKPSVVATRKPGDPMRGFLGLAKLFKTDPLSPTPYPERHERFCEVVCNDSERRRFEVVSLQEFRRAYRTARRAMAHRKRGVVFPPGTYALRIYYGVEVAEPPDDDARFERALAIHEQMAAAA